MFYLQHPILCKSYIPIDFDRHKVKKDLSLRHRASAHKRMQGARTIRTLKFDIAALAIALSLLPGPIQASSQTLARPGWVGSGLTTQTWFKHAILYRIDPRTFAGSKPDSTTGDLKGITQRLDYIHSLSVDAILLKPLSAAIGGQPTTIDPALGTLDDLDDLTLQASRFKIRILLELPAPDLGTARFWLTRGIAGFYLPDNSAANAATVAAIRKLLPTFVGQRILITDADLTAASAPSKQPNELLLDRATLQPAINPVPGLRTALEQSQTLLRSALPLFAVDPPAPSDPRIAPAIATAVLLNRSGSLITAGQELGFSSPPGSTALMPWGNLQAVPAEEANEPARPAPPSTSSPDKYTPFVPYVRPTTSVKKATPLDPATAAGQDADPKSLLNFYRELGRLHHGTSALRDGEEFTLNHDDRDVLIWVRKPATPSQVNPAVLIACNFSKQPVVLSLKSEVARLQLRGTFLRTIFRSDDLMGGTSLDPITLPPFGVYIGTVRY